MANQLNQVKLGLKEMLEVANELKGETTRIHPR